MADTSRKTTNVGAGGKAGSMTTEKRRQLFGFAGIVVSLMVLLSLVSYTSTDQASGEISLLDLWRVFTNDETVAAKAATTKNWLGLLGAILSNWWINSTIGYASIVVPFLGFLWSLHLISPKNLRRLASITTYTLSIAVLFAASAGTLKHVDDLMALEWSGIVGHFLAHIFVSLLGLPGAVVLLVASAMVLFVLMLDINLRTVWRSTTEWFEEAGANAMSTVRKVFAELPKLMPAPKPKAEQKINIRKPERELHPLPVPTSKPAETRVSVPSPQPPTREQQPVPKAAPAEHDEVEYSPDKGLRLDIHESLKVEEVNYDERAQAEEGEEDIDYVFPSVELLDVHRTTEEVDEGELKMNAELLQSKLADFGVAIESVSVTPGPVVTLYELVPATGVKISRIENLQDDIALALKAKGIRIIAPIPGKGTVGVEIPNHNPVLVTIRTLINSAVFRDSEAALPIAMGKTISGEVYVEDLTRLPHLLIAGATGSGKSVGMNTIISSLLFRMHPSELKLAIIDPKKIELTPFGQLRRHFLAVSPDTDEEIVTSPQNAVLLLKGLEIEMEKRYDKLAAAGVRNIADYNKKIKSGKLKDTEEVKHRKLPYIVVIVDELADLMITAAREVEEPIARLAQLARAVGIHLVLATQRPSVDVITGVIKANFPARIAYQVSSKIDSRTILDMNGAEQLLGNGDMLYLPPGSSKPVRLQNAFISTDEVERLTVHVGKQRGYQAPATLPSALERKKAASGVNGGSSDELFEEAARVIVRHQQGSVSLLQRRLKVGYSRAARLVDELEMAGIVGPFDGSKARQVLCETEDQLEEILKTL